MGPESPAARHALVIGNANYQNATPLRNPINDARAMGEKLAGLGFEMRTMIDADATALRQEIPQFCRDVAVSADKGAPTVAVLFFAGHGVQIDGANFLLPIDGNYRTKLDFRYQAIELDLVMQALSSSARTSIVLMDCCRDNPLPRTLEPLRRSLSSGYGLANVQAPKGVYVAFATQPHFVALDGEGSNSPFSEALLQHMADPDKHVSEVLMAVRKSVYEHTNGQQIPWDHSALFEPFMFAPADPSARRAQMNDAERERLFKEEEKAREASYWTIVRRSDDVDVIQNFVTQYPNSAHRSAALARIDRLNATRQGKRVLGGLALLLAAVTILYGGSLWLRVTPLEPNVQIAGSEFTSDDMISRPWCQVKCLFKNVFARACVAINYDETAQECSYMKEALFAVERPPTATFRSEIMPGQQAPSKSIFNLLGDRSLSGTTLAKEVVSKAPQAASLEYSEDLITGRVLWFTETSGGCQRLCGELKKACQGFTFVGGACQLFGTVRDVVRDAHDRTEVEMKGAISGCLETVEACLKKPPES